LLSLGESMMESVEDDVADSIRGVTGVDSPCVDDRNTAWNPDAHSQCSEKKIVFKKRKMKELY